MHAWFDSTKAVIPDARHRIILHNIGGIQLFCHTFSKEYNGQSVLNSDNNYVPLVSIATQHVVEDFTFVPDLLEISDLFLLDDKNLIVKQYLKFNHHLAIEKLAYKYGEEKDFLDVLRFFMTYAYLIPQASPEQKAGALSLMNNSLGIFLLEKYLGVMFTVNSTGRQIPTRLIGEQFVSYALGGVIPSVYFTKLFLLCLNRNGCLRTHYHLKNTLQTKKLKVEKLTKLQKLTEPKTVRLTARFTIRLSLWI